MPDITRSEQWQQSAATRCRIALRQSTSLADRLALVRSLVRLCDGRLDMASENIVLSSNEQSELARFGLAVNNRIIRLLEPGLPSPLSPLDRFDLDTSLRRPWIPASPDAFLIRHTGHRGYRSTTQKSAVRAVLTMPDGATLLVGMPTGSGKSLLFQIAMLQARIADPGACAVVITPTVALALDHVRSLQRIAGLEASRAITGDLEPATLEQILSAFRRGEVPILFMSPEIALRKARQALIEAATPRSEKLPGLRAHFTTFFVDEAHIIESWGRKFRPDFQRLSSLVVDLRRLNPALKVAFLSATLTREARHVLRNAYCDQSAWLEIDAGLPRYEFDVAAVAFTHAHLRDQTVDQIVDLAPRPLIIYTSEISKASTLYDRLRQRGYQRLAYFTGDVTDPTQRRQMVDDWAEDRLDMVVATSAFGMGVDKSDVRTIIHACLPETPSRWYQEIGRSGRDGHQAHAICLFTTTPGTDRHSDTDIAAQFATNSWLTRSTAIIRWKALIDHATADVWNDGRRCLTLDLDSRHHGIPGRSSKTNREWSMSLLTLLQRAGVIDVLSSEDQTPSARRTWTIAINAPAILDPAELSVWDSVFAARDHESITAMHDLNAFQTLMTKPEERCIIKGVFALLDGSGSTTVPACGRCPACRRDRLPPPQILESSGLELVWPVSPEDARLARHRRFPTGITLLEPEDPSFSTGLPTLLNRLTAVDVDQFVIPDQLVSEAAELLAATKVGLGLILSHTEFLGLRQPALPDRTAAILLDHDDRQSARILSQIRAITAAAVGHCVIVVSRPDRIIDLRRLDQSLSSCASYSELVLEQFTASSRSTQ